MARVWRDVAFGELLVGKLCVSCVLSSPELRSFLMTRDRDGRAHLSYFDPDPATIVICASVTRDAYPLRFLRELLHASFFAAGSTAPDFWLVEERSTRMLAPVVLPVLAALGFRAPPLPDTFDAMHAHACYTRRRMKKEGSL